MPASVDRGEIIHLAGRHRLSPALREGAPALVAQGDGAGRCGWAPFFAALEARRLAVAFEPDDPDSIRIVARPRDPGAARPSPSAAAGPDRSAIGVARRFLAALRGRWPPA